MKEEDLYYVSIPDAGELKKLLLYTSKDLVYLLQKQEKIASLRQEKLKLAGALKNILEEIALLSSRMKKKLPRAQIPETRFPEKPVAEQARMPAEQPRAQSTPKRATSEIDRLNKELTAIEAKLATLE